MDRVFRVGYICLAILERLPGNRIGMENVMCKQLVKQGILTSYLQNS